MATPRKKNKIRDSDRTRKRLLEVVGEILKESGFTGLKTNNIARHLGKDKRLIRYYFHSLYNLEKEFILENDHWISFFRDLQLPEGNNEDGVKQVFIDLMHEHFEFFAANIEMQKIMLWQLTEDNPLMRSVAEYREREGERLFKTAERMNSRGARFRAVTALVLGGIYFLSLQAATNKCTVCGVDINNEKDRVRVLEAIEQIIGCAWVEYTGKDTDIKHYK